MVAVDGVEEDAEVGGAEEDVVVDGAEEGVVDGVEVRTYKITNLIY